MDRRVFRLGAAALAMVTAAPVMAEDIYLPSADEAFKWTGGVGIVALRGERFVFADTGSSDVMSHLIWESTAPMLSGGLDVTLPDGWTFAAKADGAIAGDSYMEDYDWLDYDGAGPHVVDYTTENWTHRSQHDLTDLDHYFSGSLLIGRDLALREGFKLNVNGGFKYTDVQWTAYGGTAIYSGFPDAPGGFRDVIGGWPDDLKGITYRQSFPALIAGLDGEVSLDNWTLGASAHAGFTFMGVGDDFHWLRDVNFVDLLQPAPIVSVEASASYAITDGLNAFVSASAEQVFAARGDIDADYISDGSTYGDWKDSAGDALFAAKLSGGIKGSF